MKRFVLLTLGILLLGICSGCVSSWGIATSADAIKVTPSDPSAGQLMPTVIFGGGANSMLFIKPYEQHLNYARGISYARRTSFFDWLSGNVNAGNVTCVYISDGKETPEETEKILKAFARIVNKDHGPDQDPDPPAGEIPGVELFRGGVDVPAVGTYTITPNNNETLLDSK